MMPLAVAIFRVAKWSGAPASFDKTMHQNTQCLFNKNGFSKNSGKISMRGIESPGESESEIVGRIFSLEKHRPQAEIEAAIRDAEVRCAVP
jgi:hypothetical protein